MGGRSEVRSKGVKETRWRTGEVEVREEDMRRVLKESEGR